MGSSLNYSTLLLEEESGLLYVGGRGVLYALNMANISTAGGRRVSPPTVVSHVVAWLTNY